MSFFWVTTGFILLVIGGEYLVRASVALSFKLHISKMIIGMTVVSFATSVPELLVSLQAALLGSPAIAINNVVGSNIANIGLVLGVTALLGSIVVDKSFYKMNWPVMMMFSIMLYYFLSNDQRLSAVEGGILFLTLLVFLVYLIYHTKKNKAVVEVVDDALAQVSVFKIVIWLLIGSVALYFGSQWLVAGATSIAQSVGVSESVIGVSLIAIGTSVPELAASIIAAAKKEKALSLGNLIGSNIFNIGSVLGLTAMISPIPVTEPQILQNDIFWMLGFAALLLPLVLVRKCFEITRIKGFLLVFAYAVFIFLLFTKSTV